ncbi:MAG: GNAT family N-acetyltransferase [Pseudolysinimonas sp.]
MVSLHVIGVEEARRIVAGTPLPGDRWHPEYPLADELDVLRPLAATPGGGPAPDPVFGLMMIRDAAGLAVGGIGFFGPPDADGRVEIGYGLVPAARGRGLASAALAEAIVIAAAHGVTMLRADTDPANLPSSRVLERAGFVELPPSDGLRHFALTLPT